MNASTRAIAFVTAVAVTLPDRVLLILCGAVATLALLMYLGIVMPGPNPVRPPPSMLGHETLAPRSPRPDCAP